MSGGGRNRARRGGFIRWLLAMVVMVIVTVVLVWSYLQRSHEFFMQWSGADHMPPGAVVYGETHNLTHVWSEFLTTEFYQKWRGIEHAEQTDVRSSEGGSPQKKEISDNERQARKGRRPPEWMERLTKGLASRPLAVGLYLRGGVNNEKKKSTGTIPSGSFPGAVDLLVATPDRWGSWPSMHRYLERYADQHDQGLYRDQTMEMFVMPDDMLFKEIFLTRIDGEIWLTSRKDLLKEVIDIILDKRSGLSRQPIFHRLVEVKNSLNHAQRRMEPGVFILIDPGQSPDWIRVIDEAITDPNQRKKWDEQRGLWTFMAASTITVSLAPPHWRMEWTAYFSPQADFTGRPWFCPPQEHDAVQMVPASTIFYQFNHCMDWASMIDLLAKESERGGKGERQAIGAANDAWRRGGRDFVSYIGREFGVIVTGVQSGTPFPMPKMSVFFSLNDEEGFQSWLSETIGGLAWLRPRTSSHNGHTFVQWGSFFGLEPSSAVMNGYWVVSLFTADLKQVLDVASGEEPSLPSDEDTVMIIPSLNPQSRVSSMLFIRPPQWVPLLRRLVGFAVEKSQQNDVKRAAFVAGMERRLNDLRLQRETLLKGISSASGASAEEDRASAPTPSDADLKVIDDQIAQIEASLDELRGRERQERLVRRTAQRMVERYVDLALTIPVLGVTVHTDPQRYQATLIIDWAWP